jgi:hypothetical protein
MKVKACELGFYPFLVLNSQCWVWGRKRGDNLTVPVEIAEGDVTGRPVLVKRLVLR